MHRLNMRSGGRYPVLRATGILYLFGGIVVLAVGLYWTWWVVAYSLASTLEKIGMAAVVLAATFFALVTVLSIAELIKLLIDIEHNTRAAANHADPARADSDEESAEAALLRGH